MLKVRFAKKSDDFKKIGLLLYLTDPYIYPYWFGDNAQVGAATLAKLCQTKNCVFYYKNIAVAQLDGQIVGAICFFDDKADLSYSYAAQIENNKRTVDVVEGYLNGLVREQKPGIVNISNVCVFEPYRRRGVASALLQFVLDKYKNVDTIFQIEVVADNAPARALYAAFGFERVKKYFGFCMSKKLPCLLIQKRQQKQ